MLYLSCSKLKSNRQNTSLYPSISPWRANNLKDTYALELEKEKFIQEFNFLKTDSARNIFINATNF